MRTDPGLDYDKYDRRPNRAAARRITPMQLGERRDRVNEFAAFRVESRRRDT